MLNSSKLVTIVLNFKFITLQNCHSICLFYAILKVEIEDQLIDSKI